MLLELERPLIIIDVETTGIHLAVDRIVQIGLVKIWPEGKQKEWETLVNPEMPIPEEISKIHGITDEMVKDEAPFGAIAPGLIKGLQDSDIGGYNVEFDLKFLTQEFKRAHLTFRPNYLIDSFKIFQKKEPRNLKAAVKYFLSEDFSGHRALTDAKITLRVLEAQLERYPDLPRSVRDLNSLLFKGNPNFIDAKGKFIWKNGEAIINFGTHGGTPIKDVPKEYFDWIVKAGFSDEVKEIAKKALNGRYPSK